MLYSCRLLIMSHWGKRCPIFFSNEVQVCFFSIGFVWLHFGLVFKCFKKWTTSFCRKNWIFDSCRRLFWPLKDIVLFIYRGLLSDMVFKISPSIDRQLNKKCRWAGSKKYVRTHITKPPRSLKCLIGNIQFT